MITKIDLINDREEIKNSIMYIFDGTKEDIIHSFCDRIDDIFQNLIYKLEEK